MKKKRHSQAVNYQKHFFYYRSNRYTYRLLVWWCFCYLGKNLCVSLPAWTVTRIRGTFQSNQYRTFKDPELVSLEKEQNNIQHNTYILMFKQNKNKHNIKISNEKKNQLHNVCIQDRDFDPAFMQRGSGKATTSREGKNTIYKLTKNCWYISTLNILDSESNL